MTRKQALEVFQIKPDASADEIKSRWRELSRDIHPDKHPGNSTIADLYSRISTAYSILCGDLEPDPEPEVEPGAKKGPPVWLLRATEVAAARENKQFLQEILGGEDAANIAGAFARAFLGTLKGGK